MGPLILNQIKDRNISPEREKLGLVGKVLLEIGVVASIFTGSAKASEGELDIRNYIGSDCSILCLIKYDGGGISEGYDSWDCIVIPPLSGQIGIGSAVEGNILGVDYRPANTLSTYDVELFYNGNVNPPKGNHLEFSFPYGSDLSFGSQDIIFDSNNLKYGKRVNVRNAIANNSGVEEMNDLPAGTYVVSAPYASGKLTIGTEPLAELNGNDIVDFADYSILANDFGKPQEKYTGDISGPNGIPDGYVDMYDIEAFCNDWLQ
ncbi:MAG: hypothetical protein ABSH16_07970 [Sedimentisphaerales bacterium]